VPLGLTVAAAVNVAAPLLAVWLAGCVVIVIVFAGTVSSAELLVTSTAFVDDTTTR
jgi:beta-lactamase regulating signal transducer with metallopeptidase domain